MKNLTEEQIRSIRKSYLNIVDFFLIEEEIASRFLRCLLKWGFQLQLSPQDLENDRIDISHLAFSSPSDKAEKIEALYHLVYMICLDQVVEDVELEIATLYAEKLGFNAGLVSDLLKCIVTADTDGSPPLNVRERVDEFLKLHYKAGSKLSGLPDGR